MKKFFDKYFEFILIGLTITFLLVKYKMPQYGERISMLFFGSLSFYYLASGVLVFLDKKRIGRMMRLIYFIGLWAISFAVIAVMARTLLLQLDKEALTTALFACLGTLLFCILYFNRLEEKDKPVFRQQIQPLATRSIVSIIVVVAFLIISNYAVYNLFGTHRENKIYVQKVVNAYENPEDSVIVNDFKMYDESLRVVEEESDQ